MKYIQFYQHDLSGKITEAIGDRSVIIVDARERGGRHNEIARRECIKRNYVGYRMFSGARFTDARPDGPYVRREEDNHFVIVVGAYEHE